MRFSKLVLGLILVVGLGFVGCKSESNKESEKINVGAMFSLSGSAAAYGEDLKKGTELAINELNSNKKKYKLIIRDTKSEKNEAVKAYEDLVNINNVDVVIGPTISPNALVLGKFADQYKIPLIVQAATQDEITDSRSFVTRICFNDSYQGASLANFAKKDLDKKKAVIIYDKSVSYSVGLAQSFEKNFKELGGKIISKESYSVKDRDFRSLIEKVARFEADVLFIPGWDENVGPMLRQSDEKWNKFIILGGDGWPTDKLFELSGGNLKNVYALGHFNPVGGDKQVDVFIKKYNQVYKKNPSPHAALGYDAVYVLDKAINLIEGDVTPEKIQDNLKKLNSVQLVTGDVEFTDSGKVVKTGVILKMSKDGYEFIKTIGVK